MPGTIATPSGEITACTNTGNEEVYNCSNCKEVIPLPPNQKIQTVCQQIQDHLEQCMPTSVLHNSFKGNIPSVPTPNRISPLSDLCMPLQPRRTWSAEDERRRRLEEDPDAYDVGPHTVTCAGCHRPIRLNATGRYYAANWNKHKMGCKNTNALNGAGAMSPESKFTGRVAAFRVAKPAESIEPFVQGSPSSVPTVHKPQQPPYQASSPTYVPQANSYDNSVPWGSLESRRDQFLPKGLSEVDAAHERAAASSSLHYQEHSTSRDYIYYNRADSEGSQPSASGGHESSPHIATHRPSRSPNAPSPRLEEEGGEGEAYGYDYPPYGSGRERYGQDTRMGSTVGLHRAREGSLRPLRHSIDRSREGAYFPAPAALPEIRRPLDKGKARHTEPRESSQLHSTSLSRLQKHPNSDPITQRNDPHARTQGYDSHTFLDLYEDQRVASHRETRTTRAKLPESRNLEEDAVFSDLGSYSATSSPELNASRPNRPPSAGNTSIFNPRQSTRGHFDDRTLPPLSSLTLARASDTDPSLSSTVWMSRRQRPQSNERHPIISLTHNSGHSPNWRERTRRWVQTDAALSASELDTSESVVLPPIRTDSHRVNPPGVKRRLTDDDEREGESMDAHRPSPPKVFVLPQNQNLSDPSKLRTDDLSLRYKHSRASSVEATNVGGDSKGKPDVGTSSERANTARLHPVWKWEQKEETASASASSLHNLGHAEGDDDIVMGEQDVN